MDKYDNLNKEQKEAVFHTEGPLLLLAGAGSGKTRVLTHRIAYLIEMKNIAPWNILAITFTNKAAAEMKERVGELLNNNAKDIWVSTFHSFCVRILKANADAVGFDNTFSIFDKDDQKKLIKKILSDMNIDTGTLKETRVMNAISSAKNQGIWPRDYLKTTEEEEFLAETISAVYSTYQEELRINNAMDFDDLLLMTVELFNKNPQILKKYQDRFKYILVDEYQDTNEIQFKLINLLAKEHKNLCVVGDDDQSIYKFRGADIKNILNFEDEYDSAKVIRLEQNYRSSKNILNVANKLISNNKGRKVKKLWTSNEEGKKIIHDLLDNEKEEARYICIQIKEVMEEDGYSYKDFAILYRTNAQSRALEEGLMLRNIPYKLVGGTAFYQRKEIKDIIAYLRLAANDMDSLSCDRIINVPRRGIGKKTIEVLTDYAGKNGLSLFNAIKDLEKIKNLGRSAKNVRDFKNLILQIKERSKDEEDIADFIEWILEVTGYKEALEDEGTNEATSRIENIEELISKAKDYDSYNEDRSLNGFLDEIALIASADDISENDDRVLLMTLHSSKGLEFPVVFMTGMEDGIFPGYKSINSEDSSDLEEERRLAYVGITRAKKRLYLLSTRQRMLFGRTSANQVSRFIEEIPEEYLEANITHSSSSEDSETSGLSQSAQIRHQDYLKSKNVFFRKVPYGDAKVNEIENNASQRRQDIMELQEKLGVAKTEISAPKGVKLSYKVGDMIKHSRYGIGKVLKIEPGGADFQVSVQFASAGKKKLMASFARLKKVDK